MVHGNAHVIVFWFECKTQMKMEGKAITCSFVLMYPLICMINSNTGM